MMSPTFMVAEVFMPQVPSRLRYLPINQSQHSSFKSIINLLVFLVVKFFVLAVSLDVVPSFFDQSNHEHKHQWRNVCKQKPNLQHRNKLGQRNKQEEQVVEELKLIEQHKWNECDHVVLLVFYCIRHESSRCRAA